MIRAGQYLAVFAGSALISLALTPLALRVARRYGILDHPGDHKSHEEAVPYLGGAAILMAFLVTAGVGGLLLPIPSGRQELLIVFGAAAVLAGVGLLDDIKGLGLRFRFLVEILAGGAILLAGAGIEVTGAAGLDGVLTILWVVGITNAFNLLDNMDGLSAGVAAIAAGWFFVLAALGGQFLVATLAAGIAGVSLGFLRHNVHPARIYMGDAGALFLGFLLAYLGIKLQFDGAARVIFFAPILVLGVAVFDTTLVTATRLIHRRNPFLGGRDHVSHRLVFVGLPVRASVALIYAAAVACGWLALVMSRVDGVTALILMALVISVGGFAGVLLGAVPVYETSKRRRVMLREVKGHEPEPLPPAAHRAGPETETA